MVWEKGKSKGCISTGFYIKTVSGQKLPQTLKFVFNLGMHALSYQNCFMF